MNLVKNLIDGGSGILISMSGIPASTEWHNTLFNQKKNKLNKEAQLVYRYKIQYQITGIIIVIMDWFKNDIPSSIDNLVKMLNFFIDDTKILNATVPNIKIRIIDK